MKICNEYIQIQIKQITQLHWRKWKTPKDDKQYMANIQIILL